ncbi:MAG: HIT family protein [Succinatimonas sp.]|nr:HIT family protein [Succinatimonas sp.]
MLKDDNCFYCEDGEKRKSLMIEICKFEKSTLYLNRDQKHLGRVVLKYHEHKTDPSELTVEENQQFFGELACVAKAIMELFHPDKINYAIYGDGVPHLHVHIVPKYKDGLHWGGPFLDTCEKKLLSDSEYEDLIAKFKQVLGK